LPPLLWWRRFHPSGDFFTSQSVPTSPLFLKLNGADNLSALGRSYARGAQLLVLGFNEAFSLELLASPPPFFEGERALGVILIL
jgi:hypothetical protein